MKIRYYLVTTLLVVFLMLSSSLASASWTADVSLGPDHMAYGSDETLVVSIENITRSPENGTLWLLHFQVYLEGENGTFEKIIDYVPEENATDKEGLTKIGPENPDVWWLLNDEKLSLGPGKYNLTIVIMSSEGSFDGPVVSHNYSSTLIIDPAPQRTIDIYGWVIIICMIALVSVIALHIWRTRNDRG